MKKIKTISLSSLRTEEDFGFLKLIVTETANLPKEDGSGSSPALTAAVSAFSSAVDTFDAALKDSTKSQCASIAAEADSARDASWRGLNNYLKAMTVHPDEEKRSLAVEMKGLTAGTHSHGCAISTATRPLCRRPKKAASCTICCRTSMPTSKMFSALLVRMRG